MASINGGTATDPSFPSPPKVLTPLSLSAFSEGISLVLSLRTALQMAIQNEWGGRDSQPLYIDDLEEILSDTMTLSFNVELDDGSEKELVNKNEDESSDDEEASDMAVDEPQRPRSNSKTNSTSVDNQNQKGQADDGWSVVPPRRNKGNRQN
ncbi:hypothetical protein MKX01_000604 [Papaver californicum]|nr:hypothetical protein MKX01_000604 [Papaver californicum]